MAERAVGITAGGSSTCSGEQRPKRIAHGTGRAILIIDQAMIRRTGLMRLRCSEGAKPPIASATGFGGSWRSGNQWSNTLRGRSRGQISSREPLTWNNKPRADSVWYVSDPNDLASRCSSSSLRALCRSDDRFSAAHKACQERAVQ